MTKNCIICTNSAGSDEHTFPAAFGGRRTNKGIYCTKHNNEFGRHVAALLDSMDIINAKIGVIPYSYSEVRPAPALAQDGERFLVSKGLVTIAPPSHLKTTPELLGREVQLRFANVKQAQKWKAQQEKSGYKVNLDKPSAVKTTIIARPLKATRSFGGENFMRGIVYLAVTFLAHAFPDLARSESLAAARDLIEKDGHVGDRVWWERPETVKQRSANPFNMGHSIVISPDKEGRRVVALISFFDALHFGVDLGELPSVALLPKQFTTHIDPMARRPPNDVVEWRTPDSLQLSTKEVAKEYFHLLAAGKVPHPLGEVLRAADEAEREMLATDLLPKFLTASNLTGYDRDCHLLEILGGHQQCVFNMMVEYVTGLQQEKSLPEQVHQHFGLFIGPDENTSRGISNMSEAALHYTTQALFMRINELLEGGTLDVPALTDLLGGKEGLLVVGGALNDLFVESLPRDTV